MLGAHENDSIIKVGLLSRSAPKYINLLLSGFSQSVSGMRLQLESGSGSELIGGNP